MILVEELTDSRLSLMTSKESQVYVQLMAKEKAPAFAEDNGKIWSGQVQTEKWCPGNREIKSTTQLTHKPFGL